MASSAVEAAFRARLAANWTASPISAANAGADAPRDNTAFLTVEFPVANEEPISIGAPGTNTFRETGACRLILSIPGGLGMADWPAKFDALRATFRNQYFAGVTTWAASPPAIDDQSDDGGYLRMSSAIAYQFDLTG